MRVLVCGASGFIGRSLCESLTLRGHEVVRGLRHPSKPGDIAIDYSQDGSVQVWLPRLAGIDAVVNAVGILVENRYARFEDLHDRAPVALFSACTMAGVKRVIQISALGAERGESAYFRSKRAADVALSQLPLEWLILRPSLVYGSDGASASAFSVMASLPVIPVPALPEQAQFQPIHINDLVSAVERALDPSTPAKQTIECVGGTRHSFVDMLREYRRGMQLGAAWWPSVPAALIRITAALGSFIPRSPLTRDTWQMLREGSAGDVGALRQLLGRQPTALREFFDAREADGRRARALAAWQRPLLQYTIALVWVLTALVTAFLYPHDESLRLLAHVGIKGAWAPPILYAATAVDLAMGIASALYPRRLLWVLQGLLVLGYSAAIGIAMPEFLIHPFGPILKNILILAVLAILTSEKPRWTTLS